MRISDCIITTLRIQPAVLLYCSCSILTKVAAKMLPKRAEGTTFWDYALQILLEWRFIGIVCLIFLVMLVYAFIWQRLIKNAQIAVVYANKSSSILWGQLAAVVLFKEHLTCGCIGGLLIVFCGILLVNSSKKVNP